MKPRVVIIDDEENIRRMLGALLEQHGHEVRDLPHGAEASAIVRQFDPDLVLLDVVLGNGPDGISVLERLRADHPELVVVMMSGQATLADAVRATRLGAFQFLEKPLSPENVLVAVSAAIDLARTRRENRMLRQALDRPPTLLGESPAMAKLRRLIAQVADNDARVLITGESGTGKELVARAIHDASRRRSEAFVSFNCAAIPRELVESEMFGHERGAFTGATARRHGRFEMADRGTLFLDEVGDLAREAQAKLLRVLETGAFQRVGGERTLTVNVRILAATNKNLEAEIEAGRFREDLLYRLNVFPLAVPPLRDRPGDIALLVRHFAARVGARHGRQPLSVGSGILDRLERHTWPGNIRELSNVIERLSILCPGRATVDAVESVLGQARPVQVETGERPAESGGLAERLDAYERKLILAALDGSGGNIAQAARTLQTDRANLYRRMRRLGIETK